jgi:hypothetical protein
MTAEGRLVPTPEKARPIEEPASERYDADQKQKLANRIAPFPYSETAPADPEAMALRLSMLSAIVAPSGMHSSFLPQA